MSRQSINSTMHCLEHPLSALASSLYPKSINEIKRFLHRQYNLFHSPYSQELGVKSQGALLVVGPPSSSSAAAKEAILSVTDSFEVISCLPSLTQDEELKTIFIMQIRNASLRGKVVLLEEIEVLEDVGCVAAVVDLIERENAGVVGISREANLRGGLNRAGRFEKVVRLAAGGYDEKKVVWGTVIGNLVRDGSNRPKAKGEAKAMDTRGETERLNEESVSGTMNLQKDYGSLLAEASPGLSLHDLHIVVRKALIRGSGLKTELTCTPFSEESHDDNKDPDPDLSPRKTRHSVVLKHLHEELIEYLRKKSSASNLTLSRNLHPLFCNTSTYNTLHNYLKQFHNHREILKRLNIETPKVVILQGPPGAGKSFLLDHLRKNLSPSLYNWIVVSPIALFSKWLGESEANLREVFATAKALAPCVIQLEELEEIARQRKDGGIEGRMVGTLLKELEDVEEEIMVIGCVRDASSLDQAIVRAGRVDKVVRIERLDYDEVKRLLSGLSKSVGEVDEEWLRHASWKMTGWTAGEVERVVRRAFVRGLRDLRKTGQLSGIGQPMVVQVMHWTQALDAALKDRAYAA